MTIAGKNEIHHRENLVRPFLVHTLLGANPPPSSLLHPGHSLSLDGTRPSSDRCCPCLEPCQRPGEGRLPGSQSPPVLTNGPRVPCSVPRRPRRTQPAPSQRTPPPTAVRRTQGGLVERGNGAGLGADSCIGGTHQNGPRHGPMPLPPYTRGEPVPTTAMCVRHLARALPRPRAPFRDSAPLPGGGGVPHPLPLSKIAPNFSPGLRPIKNFLWRSLV